MTKISRFEWLFLGLTLLFIGGCVGFYVYQNQGPELVRVETGRYENPEAMLLDEAVTEAPGILEGERININTASAQDLTRLPNIGAKRAEAIVAYREENGFFASIEEIMEVSGIGAKYFASMEAYITVEDLEHNEEGA